MARRRSRSRQVRAQRIIAVILLLTLTTSGAAFYTVAVFHPVTQQPAQQSH